MKLRTIIGMVSGFALGYLGTQYFGLDNKSLIFGCVFGMLITIFNIACLMVDGSITLNKPNTLTKE